MSAAPSWVSIAPVLAGKGPTFDVLLAAERLAGETTESGIARAAVESAVALLSATRGLFLRPGVDGLELVFETPPPRGESDGDMAPRAPGPEVLEAARSVLATRTLATRTGTCVADVDATGDSAASGWAVAIPVLDGEAAHGVLYVERVPTDSSLIAADLALVGRLTPHIVVAFKNAALFTTLEQMVEQEMTRVVESEASMQLVLDSMDQGLLVCDRGGVLTPVRSKTAAEWFGVAAEGALVWDHLFPEDQAGRAIFQQAFEMLAEDELPFELTAYQMPQSMVRGQLHYHLVYQQVCREGQFTEVVITLRDVTVELEQARGDRLHRQLPAIVGQLLRDRAGFAAFVEECESLMAALTENRPAVERARILHTLKGNAAIYGLSQLSAMCHQLEDRVAAEPTLALADSVAVLVAEWKLILSSISVFLQDEAGANMQIGRDDYDDLVRRLEQEAGYPELRRLARSWLEAPMREVLGIYTATVADLARRLGKEATATIVHGSLRLPSREFRGFCASLVHVVRNAIDHGIEPAAERRRLGKPEVGHVIVRSSLEAGAFVISVEDDGAGIEWDAIAKKARLLGLPGDTPEALTEALFADGLSTRDEVTDTSGRGVGMAATRSLCESLGGVVTVRSRPGRGTMFEFTFRQHPDHSAPRAL